MSTPAPRTPSGRAARAHWQAEVDSAALYHALADLEAGSPLSQVYRRLAWVEGRHAEFWAEQSPGAAPRVSWRTRTLIALARRFGPALILPTVVGLEDIGGQEYGRAPQAQGTGMPAEERSHARLLREIAGPVAGQLGGGVVAGLEGRHRTPGGNALRAAVLGANDGLVSNLSLVMGVAGAALPGRTILVTGLAGLIAGAASMALGEWLSVQNSRELYTRQLALEAGELEHAPQEETEELALIYQAKGLPEGQAREVAARVMRNRETALDTLAREELGIDPGELGGSAWTAALTSFVLFALGALPPVLPFAFLSGAAAVLTSLGLSAAALFAIGAGTTLMTGKSVWFSGGRQVLFGLAAAALTFGVGRLIGVNVGG